LLRACCRRGAPVREDWMLPLLLQFNGEPVVTDDGDLIYIFPELMDSGVTPPIGTAAGDSGGALAIGGGSDVRRALAFSDPPSGWRPRLGESVQVGRIRQTRSRRDDGAVAAMYTGMHGVVVTDDRDYLPFGVAFGSVAPSGDGTSKADAFFMLDEILPVGSLAGAAGGGCALVELPQRFSTAPPGQLAAAGGLAALNLGAVIYLGGLLSSVAGVPATALGSSGPLIATLRRLYPPLIAYATGFVTVPAVRATLNRRKNRKIEQRNAVRRAWGRVVADREAVNDGSEARTGLRARLKRKLKSAAALRTRLRRMRPGDRDALYSSAQGVGEQAGDDPTRLPGSAFDEFDARLANAPPSSPPPSPSPPPPPLPSLQSCVCGNDPAQYSTFGNDATRCFGANDMTNLEVCYGGLPMADETQAFYRRCSDYDNDGIFRANDLTNMKRYYAGLLPVSPHIG